MRKLLSSLLAVILVTLTLLSSVSIASAASVGKVTTLKLSKRTDTTVTVKWSAVSGADGYKLYRATGSSSSWKLIRTSSTRNFEDTSLKPGTKYRYRVRAYDKQNGSTKYGSYSSVLTTATLPGKVTSLKVSSAGDTTITLKWAKTSGAAGYQVYKLNAKTGSYERYKSTTSTSMTVKSLSPNTSYSFKVRAYHKLLSETSFGTFSSVVKYTTKSTDVKGFKLSNATDNSYTLSWNQSSGIDGYNLSIYNDSTGKWTTATNTTKTSYTIIGSNLSAKYKIRSYKTIGGSKNYGIYTGVVTAGTKPSAPTGLVCSVSSGDSILIKWNAVPNAVGYQICKYNPMNGSWENIASTSKTSYTFTDVADTTTYTFKVRTYIGTSANRFYGDYCESASVYYQSNRKPESIYTESLEESGIFGYLYDPFENCFYTASDPWQRIAGYNSIYDTLAPTTMIFIDTIRLRFEYDDKDWMIQCWKGQYGLVFYGSEIGIYTKPTSRVLMHYDCAKDDEMLMMSCDFYERRTTLLNGTRWEKQYSRPYGLYWWCTGFIPGNRVGRFDNLRVDVRITMKDYTMLSAFEGALRSQNVAYTTQGLDVYFSY